MNASHPVARTHAASGRFVLVLLSLALLFFGLLVSCGPPEPAPGPEAAALPEEPAIRAGAIGAAAEAAGLRLLRRAGEAVEGEAWSVALDLSREVIDEYPEVPGSSGALRLGARAALELDHATEADSLAGRYLELVPEADARRPSTILIRGRARLARGRVGEAIRILLGLPPELDDATRGGALAAIRDAVSRLDTPRLAALASEPPTADSPLLAPVLAELAVARHFQGREEEAATLARRALSLGGGEDEERLARAVLEDRVEDVMGAPPTVGALLPTEGSPGLRRVAGLIGEGIQLATEEGRARSRRPVRLQVLDETGAPDRAVTRYRELEAGGAVGILGPLLDPALEAVARARTRPVPILSPTAGNPPSDLEAVYSLSGPDVGGARVLARYAARAGFDTAAVVFPDVPASILEARAFVEAFRASGGMVVAELPYDSGTTYFEEQLLRVAELRPEALVLPVPAGDLEVLAPQVSFFGLDTLNIRVLGTGGWTSPTVLEAVERRHTDSVVAVAAQAPGRGDSVWLAFVDAYESRYQKSLRSRVPALGYDAAGLFLTALRQGRSTPGDLGRALESIRGYQGATGTLSVEDGRVVRDWFPVLIHDRAPIPLDSAREPPIGPLPPPPPPPDTTEAGDTIRPDTTGTGLSFSAPAPVPIRGDPGERRWRLRSGDGEPHPVRRRIRLLPRG